ncbi:MAG: T9SS type A sorting domain-containing protein [Candidatus Azobacteroides sp.]|nr:T9SS type A sorting domain-containing protein [Candidatus Azobacteroides sp.]
MKNLRKIFVLLMAMIPGCFSSFSQEYINEVFQNWNNAGSGTSVFANGSQTIRCIDGELRTFTYTQCIVNNEAPSACTDGSVLVRNSGNGYITFPVLPNIGKIMISHQGRTRDKKCAFELQVYNKTNATWLKVEVDSVSSVSENANACGAYSFNYTSQDSVQIRLRLYGNSATPLFWIYVEGLEGGSGEPFVPKIDIPLPDISTVTLINDKADMVALETMQGIAGYGWDPINRGIYINWHRQYANRINCASGGTWEERNTSTRHDSQNDVRALQHFYWFKALHDNTPYFDYAIKRILPIVKAKYAKPSNYKGWMYFVLLRLRDYTDNPKDLDFWNNSLLYWGNLVYNMIDPETGIYVMYNLGNCDCDLKTVYLDKAYRVDHQVESGAALVHAGTIFNKPEWIAAGYRQVKVAYEQSFVEKYGLFGRIYLFGNSGYTLDAAGNKTAVSFPQFTNKLWDAQAMLGETSEEMDALIRAAEVTTDPEIKAFFEMIVSKMLTGLETCAIHDKKYGGFYQKFGLADSGDGTKEGFLGDSKKEMRQASLLGTYNLANRKLGPNWYAMEKEMYDLLTTSNENPIGKRGMLMPDVVPEVSYNEQDTINAYPKTMMGYNYELANDWSLFKGGNTVLENWVSNESNSLVLLGFFEYLTAVKEGYVNPLIAAAQGIKNTQQSNVTVWVDTADRLHVLAGPDAKVQVFNVYGQMMPLKQNASGLYDISSYDKGVYVVQALTPQSTVKTKFLKK